MDDNTELRHFTEHHTRSIESASCGKPSPRDLEAGGYDWFEDDPESDPKRIGRRIGEAVLEKLRG
jgi:hypothetical protein